MARPPRFQARVYAWRQAGDEDPLTPSNDIIVSPPIFTVPVGMAQTVRLLLRARTPGGGERSYRVLLDEVPRADASNNRIEFALRVSLPILIRGPSTKAPVLHWGAARGPGGQIVLTASNSGDVYDRVTALDLTLPSGAHPKIMSRGRNTYVLPGSQRDWDVQASTAETGPLHLTVTTATGKSEQMLSP
ncbi:MAG: fimbria/pilus periplasmic chaperone [Rhodospirillales bacterium]